jgi:serine phosphatase RsbU (regulator of sigma subunit)
MSGIDEAGPEDGTVFITDKTLKRLAEANAAVTPPAHFLLMLDDHEPGRRIKIDKTSLIAGRIAPADLVLDSTMVSRRHCRFDLIGDRMMLTDLASTNGTFVNGDRIAGEVALEDGAQITIGSFRMTYQRRSQREASEAQELDRDLQQAVDYVMSILPPPITSGPVRADWFYLPCARLGGDAFGYRSVDARYFSSFVIDVSGHGAGAALYGVTVANVLRQQLLPGVDFRNPAEVMGSLNEMFQMEHHNWLFFTIWYGVYDTQTRKLRYCSGGHHEAVLTHPGHRVQVGIRNPAIGVTPEHVFKDAEMDVPANSSLYLFSDGVFEVEDQDGRQWEMDDFLSLLRDVPEPGEARRLYDAVRGKARHGALDDDFSVMVLTFD